MGSTNGRLIGHLVAVVLRVATHANSCSDNGD
jgi:hypothetical protein